MRERIGWIDVCRGLGILSVIYAHGLDGNSIRYFFYAFHIPLFFFLSGIVFRHKNHEKFSSVLKKAFKNILIPYFLFAILSYVFWLFFTQFEFFSLQKLPGVVWNILYGNGNNKQFFYNVVLWFLPCLFATQVLFGTLTFFTTNKKILILALLLGAGLGATISKLAPGLTLPFGLETSLTAIFFFGIGFLWHEYHALLKTHLKHVAPVLFIFAFVGCVIAAYLNFTPSHQQIDLRVNRLNDILLFYLGALSGILMSISLSELLHKNKLLQYLGQHSMILFIWHLIIFSLLSKILLLFTSDQTIRVLRNLYLAPLYSLISILIILVGSQVLRRVSHRLAPLKLKL